MAIITTDILGQDNPSQSRISINNNFNIIKNAINSIQGVLDYTTAESILKKITINLPTVGTPISTVLFSCAASGSVVGNFSVGETINAKKITVSTGNLEVDGSNFEVKQATNRMISKGSLEVHKKVLFLHSTQLDPTAYSALTSGQYSPDTYITNVTCTGNLTLLPGEEGQVIKFYMNGNGPLNIQTTNLTTIITAPIILNAKGQILELWYKSSKWHVIGKVGTFTITYAA